MVTPVLTWSTSFPNSSAIIVQSTKKRIAEVLTLRLMHFLLSHLMFPFPFLYSPMFEIATSNKRSSINYENSGCRNIYSELPQRFCFNFCKRSISPRKRDGGIFVISDYMMWYSFSFPRRLSFPMDWYLPRGCVST